MRPLTEPAATAPSAAASASVVKAAAPPNNAAINRLIDQGLEPSYITPSSGLRLGGDHSPKNLLYEAQIVKSFNIYQPSTDSAWGLRVDAPVRLVVRQLNEESKPVRTPSYNPGLRLSIYPGAEATQYFSLGLFHYSNGQDGPSYNTDGTVNTLNGSFSTNYLELAYGQRFEVQNRPASWRLAFRNDFYGTWDVAQRNQYPRRQLKLEASLPVKLLPEGRLRLSTTYRQGFDYRIFNPVQPQLDQPAGLGDHWQESLQLWCQCLKLPNDDVRLYLRYDLGHDDYNINFQNRINRLMIGLAAPIP